MDFIFIAWLFALVVTLHNLEEAIWLPDWSKAAGRWHSPVGAREFRFAAIVLTVLAYIATGLVVVYGKESVGAYLLSGYALAMFLNVVFPHMIATVIMRRYAPETLTALLLNLPVTILLLHQALQEGYVTWQKFIWAGPLVVVCIIILIPIMFAIGRKLPGFKN